MSDQKKKRPVFEIPSHAETKRRISDTTSQCPTAFDLHSQKQKNSSSSLSSTSSSSSQSIHYLNKPPQSHASSLQEAFPQLSKSSAKTFVQHHQQQNKTIPTQLRAQGKNATNNITTSALTKSNSVGGRAAIIVNRSRQLNNPILKHVHSVAIEMLDGDAISGGCDFVLGESCGCVFIQVKYHILHPEYLLKRVREFRNAYKLQVVLCLVDADDKKAIQEINKLALVHDCTLIMAFSMEEAARYLETFKIYENKPASSIMEKVGEDYMAKFVDVLTSIRSVNKTDAGTLASNFGTMKALANTTREEMALCPGLGELKVERIYNAFHQPFRIRKQLITQPPGLQTNSSNTTDTNTTAPAGS